MVAELEESRTAFLTPYYVGMKATLGHILDLVAVAFS